MARDSDRTHVPSSSRRNFLKWGGTVAAGATLSAMPSAYAGEDNTIGLALIGCGNRGSGAVANALSAPGGPVKLHARADLFEDKQDLSCDTLRKRFGDKVDVPADRKFLGFDAYPKAIDCRRPGDGALLTTHAYCRPTHLEYAVKRGVNVFMEKSFGPRRAGSNGCCGHREREGPESGRGAECRHSPNRQAMVRPQNEAHRAVYSDLAAKMGRAAVHSGEIVPWDRIRGSDFRLCDSVDEMGYDSEAPVHDDASGQYPVPVPGEWTEV